MQVTSSRPTADHEDCVVGKISVVGFRLDDKHKYNHWAILIHSLIVVDFRESHYQDGGSFLLDVIRGDDNMGVISFSKVDFTFENIARCYDIHLSEVSTLSSMFELIVGTLQGPDTPHKFQFDPNETTTWLQQFCLRIPPTYLPQKWVEIVGDITKKFYIDEKDMGLADELGRKLLLGKFIK